MKNAVIEPVSDKTLVEQEKKQIMLNIKSLQRDLIKASFQQSSAPGAYAELLQSINDEREKLKSLNKQ